MWSLRRTIRRGTHALLWFVLVAMVVSLIVQASAVGLASPAESPVIERLDAAPVDGDAPVPELGDQSDDPTVANVDDATTTEPVPSIVDVFEGTPDPTFPPPTSVQTREWAETGPADDARTVDETDVQASEEDASFLDNDARQTIYEEVSHSPGISMSEVAERTAVPLSTVRYHTWVLNKEDVLDEAKIRGKRRLFPTMMERERKELNAALEDDATARLLDTIQQHEPASVSELADADDRAASTVSYHLQRLQEAGLVERERDDGATVTRLDPFVRAELSGTIETDGGATDELNGPSSEQ